MSTVTDELWHNQCDEIIPRFTGLENILALEIFPSWFMCLVIQLRREKPNQSCWLCLINKDPMVHRVRGLGSTRGWLRNVKIFHLNIQYLWRELLQRVRLIWLGSTLQQIRYVFEGIIQRTYMHNPETQTGVWWRPEGRGGWGLGGGGQRGVGNEDLCNSVNNKNKD